MKKIKSILAFALALSMCASMAACGSSDDDSDDKSDNKTTSSAAAKADDKSDDESKASDETSSSDESTADDESKADESDTDAAQTMEFSDVKDIAAEILAEPTLDDCEKMMLEKFDVDVSSREVVEFDMPDDQYCTVIVYDLKTPIDVFGKDGDDRPLPVVNGISVTSYTTDLVPVAFDIEMTETKEMDDYYTNEAGMKRAYVVKARVKSVINSKYSAYEVDDQFIDRWSIPEENLTIASSYQTLTGADKEGDVQYSVDFRNLGD